MLAVCNGVIMYALLVDGRTIPHSSIVPEVATNRRSYIEMEVTVYTYVHIRIHVMYWCKLTIVLIHNYRVYTKCSL